MRPCNRSDMTVGTCLRATLIHGGGRVVTSQFEIENAAWARCAHRSPTRRRRILPASRRIVDAPGGSCPSMCRLLQTVRCG